MSVTGKSASDNDAKLFIPEHELIRPIAAGAYGEVWLARNVLGTLRAIKIVRRDQHASAESFEREFRGLQKFEPVSRTHEDLVDILTLGLLPENAGFYYAMELADALVASSRRGHETHDDDLLSIPDQSLVTSTATINNYAPRTLRAELKARGALAADKVIALGLKLGAALAHLHAHGLVHRDVKPSNILFIGGVPKLADAGLVAPTDDARSLVGTAGYIAPEGPGTAQADLYALGKVLYEAAFGKDRQEFPTLPGDLASRIDHAPLLEINVILLKACASDGRKRYQSADEFRADLELLYGGRSVRRKRTFQHCLAVFAHTVVVIVALATVVTVASTLKRRSDFSDLHPDGVPSTNEVAEALCTKALLTLRGDNYAAFTEAYTNLHRAIALDANFAKPYVGLFELCTREKPPSLPRTSLDDVRHMSRKLKELAPHLGIGYCAHSMVDFYSWNFPEALESARQSVKLSPSYEFGHLWYGFILIHMGYPEEGRKQVRLAQMIAPSKATVHRALGHSYYVERDYTNAIAMYSQAIEGPSGEVHEMARKFIGNAFRAMGNYLEALSCFEKVDLLSGANETETKRFYDGFRQAFLERGPRGYWEQTWKNLENNPVEDFYQKAIAQIHLGNTNTALSLLEKASEHCRGVLDSDLTYLLFDECWDGLCENQRFKKLLEKVGFSKVIPLKSSKAQPPSN